VPSLAAPAGWLGWATQVPLNLRLVVLPPAQVPADTYVPLTLSLTSTPADPSAGPGEHQVLPYATPGVFALSVPPEVPL
jgi:hypothetical protein